jgi:DNA polymerase elongation subunit (family B)
MWRQERNVEGVSEQSVTSQQDEERLVSGDVEIRGLVVSKRITKDPRDYQKAGVTTIAAQQLFGSGAKLRPGQTSQRVGD